VKKRLVIFTVIAVLGIAIGLWLLGPAGDTFVYEGKSVEDWSLQLFGAPSQKDRDEAAAAFKRMGSQAVPGLVRQLRSKDPFFRKQAWAIKSRLPAGLRRRILGGVKPLEAALLRAAAARSLGAIGPDAKPALPVLTHALRDKEAQVSLDAATALAHLGPASVPELINALNDKGAPPSVRHMAAYALGEIGPGSEPAIPALTQSLSDDNEYVRSSATYALRKIGEPARRAILDIISNGRGTARQAAAKALMGFNPPFQEAIPLLLATMTDDLPGARAQAIETLVSIRAFDARVITNLTVALKDPSPEVRLAAVKALSEAGWKAQAAIPPLIDCLKDESALIRIWAARALGNIGTPAKSAVPILAGLTEEKNEAVRAAAQEALAKIEPTGPPDASPRP
jgi:HEAT repeat protein